MNPKQQTFFFSAPEITRQESLQKGIIPDEYRGDLVVYLLHFPPIGGQKHKISHYLGCCKDLSRRLQQHRRGKKEEASAITHALKNQKIKFHVGHVWAGVNREFEHYVKSWQNHKRFCEICQDVPFF